MADGDAAHLVAEDDGEVIGFCSLHFRERLNYPTPEAWVPDLIVSERARRRGAARALLEEAERPARVRRLLGARARIGVLPRGGAPPLRRRSA